VANNPRVHVYALVDDTTCAMVHTVLCNTIYDVINAVIWDTEDLIRQELDK
jgi:hypothetical protein